MLNNAKLLSCDFCSIRTKALAILFPSVIRWSSINDFVNFSGLFYPSAPKLSLFRYHAWAESFYNVNYGPSIITSKSLSKNLSNQNKHLWWYYKNSSFWHFNSRFVLKTTKTRVFVLITEIFWQNFWCNNWGSIIDVVERLLYCQFHPLKDDDVNFVWPLRPQLKTLLYCDFCSMRTKASATLFPSVVRWYN